MYVCRMCTTSMGLLRIYLRICNAQSLIFLLLNFMFLCGACIFMIRETIFIGSAERPPNTLCQHNTNHETQHLYSKFGRKLPYAQTDERNQSFDWSWMFDKDNDNCTRNKHKQQLNWRGFVPSLNLYERYDILN